MPTSPDWRRFVRKWLSQATRSGTTYRPRCRPALCQLEQRTVPAFSGWVSVAGGDVNGDGYADLVTGAGTGGGPHVRVLSGQDGTDLYGFFAYAPAFTGGVSVAVGDVNGDGYADIVTGAGPGGGPHVRVFDGRTGADAGSFYAFDPAFTGGVSVAVGDVNGDGYADIVTGAGPGGGPHVRVFDGTDRSELLSLVTYAPDFSGGVNVAAADVTGDGVADIVTGAGEGGGPHVRVFDGVGGRPVGEWFAYAPAVRGGVRVAAGDVTGDGRADVVTAAGVGGGPHVRVFDAAGFGPVTDFMAFADTFRGGAAVATTDLDADGRSDLIAAEGIGGRAEVRAFASNGLTERARFTAYDPAGSPGGFSVFVGPPGVPPVVPPVIPGVPPVGPAPGPSTPPIVPPGAPPVAPPTVPPVTPPVVPPAVPPVVPPTLPPVTPPTVPPSPPVVSTADFAGATAFLYTGPDAVQTGVVGTIDPMRAAVIRGRTVDRAMQPLTGVVVSVLGHPEFGRTTSQADGWFSMAVNGGGLLTVDYAKAGFLPSQRQVNAPWRDYEIADEVALVALDDRVTAIDLTSVSTPIQVAQGNAVTDEDGTRRATVLFPQGVQATMTLPDGTTRPLTTLNVRATEYTVGASGPAAMPGTLPPTSGYTYAVELSVDQAMAAGATEVAFSQPVPFYVENFLNFPAGMAVPAGYYDRERGVWIASVNGRVVRILSESGGLANLDGDGDGTADGAAALAALGVTDAERAQLATLYDPGASLWRVPITHFTPWDCNWPLGPPDGATGSDAKPDELKPPKVDDPSSCVGSVIGVENQTLGEVIPIAGTPFSLVYSSDRAPGYTADRTLTVPLTRGTPPAGLRSVELTVEVAGRRFTQSFSPSANLNAAFTWDGIDAYGRTLTSGATASVVIGYVYGAQYYSPAAFVQAFGSAGSSRLATNRARQEVRLSQQITVHVGGYDARTAGLGGMTLDVHHSYDPVSGTLLMGDGTNRSAEQYLGGVIKTTAGYYAVGGPNGDGGSATHVFIQSTVIAAGPDGSIYFVDAYNSTSAPTRVRRVRPDGTLTTVAGNGSDTYSGDGGPATLAGVHVVDLAVGPDGSLYLADGISRVRRVGPDGIITTVVGNGSTGFGSGDGGPATQAVITPYSVAIGPEGSLYVSDLNPLRGGPQIRRVGLDGVIHPFAGNRGVRVGVDIGDGGPASLAAVVASDLAVGRDGSVYVADFSNRIRKIGPDGIITTVAGNGALDHTGDGGPATDAAVSPTSIAVAADGSLYIAEKGFYVIRRVGTDGIITTVAGNRNFNPVAADGQPARQAGIIPAEVTVGPDGDVYFSDHSTRILRVTRSLPGFSNGDIGIASEDGSELYRFSAAGRHIDTRDALTGAIIYSFGYDAAGRLASVADATGNVTTIEHDAAGKPTAIVGQFGQRTTLGVNADGLLTRVTNAANETTSLGYGANGLLTSFTDPNGNRSAMTYDSLGRLTRDEDQLHGFTQLTRQALDGGGYQVTTTNAVDGTRQYRVEFLPDGSRRRTSVDGRGFASVMLIGTDGSERTTAPDGTVATTTYGPDPRFGMLAPVVTKQTVVTPSGLTSTTTGTRTATIDTSNGPSSTLLTQTDTVIVNGQTFMSVYTAAAHTITSTSAAGRVATSTLDELGRTVLVSLPSVEPTRYTYDSRGRIATIAQGTRTVTNDYDAQGRLSVVTDPLGRTTRLEYDAAGRVVRQTQPDGTSVTFEYDAAGNMTAITPPGRPRHTFTYDDEDQLTATTPPAVGPTDDSTRYVYNLAHQLVREALPGGQIIEYAYCDCGRLTGVTTPWGVYAYSYSTSTGQLGSLASPGGFSVSFGYDGGLVTSETVTGPVPGRIDRTYDNDFRLASEAVNGGGEVTFAYDADGLLTRSGALTLARDAANGRITGTTLGVVSDSFNFSSYGELSQYQARINAAVSFADEYTRDALGRITRKLESVGGVSTTTDYGYDLTGQLVRVTVDGVLTQRYTYDANGNRLSLVTSGGTVAGSYDAQDRLLTYGTKSYAYAPDGALRQVTDAATGETTRYTYDGFGNLTRVDLPGGRVLEYLIDGQNRRVGKKVDGVFTERVLYDGQLTPVATLDAAGAVETRFVYATGVNVPAYMVRGGMTYRIITDQLGSVRLVVNTATGTIAQRLDYDAFGAVTLDTNPGFQPFGFSGGLYDADTRVVRFGARDYDAQAGRWAAKDPIGAASRETNFYRYASNRPVNNIDNTGYADYAAGVDGTASLGFGITGGIGIYINSDDLTQSGVYVTGGPVTGFHFAGGTQGGYYPQSIAGPALGVAADVGPVGAGVSTSGYTLSCLLGAGIGASAQLTGTGVYTIDKFLTDLGNGVHIVSTWIWD